MFGGPKPMCREITMLCRVDRNTRIATFKVWERNGLSGTDPVRRVLYEGERYGDAYDAMMRNMDYIEEGLLPPR